MPSATELTVVELNDLESLRRLQPVWETLLAATPGATFFQTCEWFTTRVEEAQGSLKPRVIVVSDGDKPVGILPLVVTTYRRRVGSFRALGYPLDDWGGIYGPIGPDPSATLAAGFERVRRTPRNWDLLELAWIDRDHSDAGRTRQMLSASGFVTREAPHTVTAQVELEGTWDAYWAARTSHWRTNLRRSEKGLAAMGKVRHIRYRSGDSARGEDDPRWDLFDACVELATRTWQAHSSDGTTMSHASVQSLLRRLHAAAARRGNLDVNLLTVNDQPVAYAYNYFFRDTVYGLRMGYDPAYSGAGNVLICRAIEDSFRRGDALYDLGADSLDCKRRWLTRLIPTFRYTHFPWNSPRAQGVRLWRWWRKRRKART